MIEIKFRAWHKVSEIMLPDEKVNNLRFCIRNENVDLMQFTGQKDCNGIEIYEEDILENPAGVKGIVQFLDGSFCSVTSNGTYILTKAYLKNKKVIGNVYENTKRKSQ